MPVATDTRLKIAVFIDFDNIEIGVKTTLGNQFEVGPVLEAIKERGDIVSKVAYGDWKRAGDHSRLLGQHAVRLVQRNLTPGGDKNGADINLALDALEMALTHPHITAFVIVGGDSDFITLVEKLKQYDKQVLVVGGRQFTSVILQKNCHEFIAYENLVAPARRARGARERAQQPAAPAQAPTPLEQVFPLVERALGILSEREVSPQLGLLKSTLLQLDSTFSERDYGASTFRDFVEKLAKAGLVSVYQSGRNVFVELLTRQVEEPPAEEAVTVETVGSVEETAPPAAPLAEAIGPAGRPEDAVRLVRAAFERSPSLRWPMYMRNVRQIVRASEPGFDERRYGLGGLHDLVRACQRDGLFRLERDRKGAMRVFAGDQFRREVTGAEPALELEPVVDLAMPVDVDVTGLEEPARIVDADVEAALGLSPHGGTSPVTGVEAVPGWTDEARSGPDAGVGPAVTEAAEGSRPKRRRRSGAGKAAAKPARAGKPSANADTPRGRRRKSPPKE